MLAYNQSMRVGLILVKDTFTYGRNDKENANTLDCFSEGVGLLRLVKMFGWETRIETQLGEKREAELVPIKQFMLYTLFNNQIT